MIIRKVSYFKRDKLQYIFQKIVIKILYNSLIFIIFTLQINNYNSYEYH